ncbi:MAG: SusC/RagA family TonB-linked outer membrane protein [Bacteroidetes bacterium]|nr:SusC/RagA family TonB-linked outer membrane protein [Bacteroidota bacterium]
MRIFKPKAHLKSMSLVAMLCFIAALMNAQSSYRYAANWEKQTNSGQQYQQPDTKNDKLVTVLKELNKVKGVYFMFSSNLGDKTVNKVDDLSSKVETILGKILLNTGLTYKKINANTFVILTTTSAEKGSMSDGEIVYSNMITIEPIVDRPDNELTLPANTITGKVSDNAGTPLANVSVTVKGKSTGTSTDSRGMFSISADKGDILVFTSIGFEAHEVKIGNSDYVEVTLSASLTQMSEVVVTALGIGRQKKSLTYSVQTVDNSSLNTVKDANLVNNLTGRVAGVDIARSSSGIGGSVRVVIRGNKSTRDNQPLYVIDGIPMENSSPGQPGSTFGFGAVGNGGSDGGDGISNMNPADIQSITVLKGASAAALYGSSASNGVIVITTKKGTAGATRVNVSSDITFDKPVYLPPLQFKYGQTVRPSEGNPGSEDSWGGVVNAPDHVKSYFQTGITTFNNISISGGTDKSQTYFSYSYTDNKGVVPGATFNKHNINLHQTTDFFNGRLKADVNVMYIHELAHNRPTTGLNNSPLHGVYQFPRGLDFNKYKENYSVYSSARNMQSQNWWNMNYDSSVIYPGNFAGGGIAETQNPYWLMKRNSSDNIVDRVITNISLRYKINDWLDLQARGNIDKSLNDLNYNSYATTSLKQSGANGGYDFGRFINTQLYGDLILNATRKLSTDLSLQATLGTSINDSRGIYSQFSTDENGDGLRFANVFTLANILPSNYNVSDGSGHSQQQAVFATTQFNFRDYLYLDLTGRNDWSSAFAFTPVEKKGYFYYSAGLTGVLSDILKMPRAISYSKVRLSYAKVGNSVPSYRTNPPAYYINNQTGSYPNTSGPKPGTYLKPEDNRSFEVGTEWSFANNRVGFDFTYYINNNFRQYIAIPVSGSSTGNLSTWYLNSGNIKNNGVELSVFATPVHTPSMSWTSTVNFASNKNKIVQISDAALGVSQKYVVLTGLSNNMYGSYITEGGSWGDIYGYFFKRDASGAIVVDDDNVPIKGEEPNSVLGSPSVKKLGNPNPDFTLGWNNSITYKNLKINFLFDGRFGGEVMAFSSAVLDQLGVTKATADARDGGGVKIAAVHEDGTKLASLDPKSFYTAVGGRDGISEYYMYDATNIRLRELSVGYSIPVTAKWVKNFTVSLISRNLFFVTRKAPYDPETTMATDNGLQGVDVFGSPNTRSIGLSVKLGF